MLRLTSRITDVNKKTDNPAAPLTIGLSVEYAIAINPLKFATIAMITTGFVSRFTFISHHLITTYVFASKVYKDYSSQFHLYPVLRAKQLTV
jgi:hypothetical protein